MCESKNAVVGRRLDRFSRHLILKTFPPPKNRTRCSRCGLRRAPLLSGRSSVAGGDDVGLTFDTGALIGLERRRAAIRKVFATAIENDVPIVVPTIVIAEWWRRGAHEKERAAILRAVHVEVLGAYVARLAGIAVGMVPGAGTNDAIVMASAALRGDTVYTSDLNDLARLRDRVPEFSAVQILQA